jgi:hypothetical protein
MGTSDIANSLRYWSLTPQSTLGITISGSHRPLLHAASNYRPQADKTLRRLLPS